MTKKKLTPAQKFHRRLAAQRVRDRFFQHDNRSSSRSKCSTSPSNKGTTELQSAIERPGNAPNPFPAQKTRKMKRSNYWRQVKLRKKQKQEKRSIGSCCCHCACSEIRTAPPGTHIQLPSKINKIKLLKNGQISTKLLVKQLSNLHDVNHRHYLKTMHSTSSVLRYLSFDLSHSNKCYMTMEILSRTNILRTFSLFTP